MSQADRAVKHLIADLGKEKTATYIVALSGYTDARRGETSRANQYTGAAREWYLQGWEDGQKQTALRGETGST